MWNFFSNCQLPNTSQEKKILSEQRITYLESYIHQSTFVGEWIINEKIMRGLCRIHLERSCPIKSLISILRQAMEDAQEAPQNYCESNAEYSWAQARAEARRIQCTDRGYHLRRKRNNDGPPVGYSAPRWEAPSRKVTREPDGSLTAAPRFWFYNCHTIRVYRPFNHKNFHARHLWRVQGLYVSIKNSN